MGNVRLGDSLTFYELPKVWWRKSRTTNVAEGVIGLQRSRLRRMGAFALRLPSVYCSAMILTVYSMRKKKGLVKSFFGFFSHNFSEQS